MWPSPMRAGEPAPPPPPHLYLYARRHACLRRDSLLRAVDAFGRHPEGGHGGSRGARPPWEGAEPTDGWSVTERTVESAPRWANSSTVRHPREAACRGFGRLGICGDGDDAEAGVAPAATTAK